MMTNEDFLRTIRANPWREENWLIYSDWLQDQGDYERGALYRQRYLTNSLGMKLALIPRGTFWMSENGDNAQRQVEMAYEFYLGIYPVTQGEWQEVMGCNPSYFSRTGKGKDKVAHISDVDLREFPVECVTWDDVQQFLEKLNAREQSSEWLYRLPTETEWEYSCRGGLDTKEDCSFAFYFDQPSNDLSSTQANFRNNLGRTCQVGMYRPNRLGLYDMHGNVWEWCNSEITSPVLRGGSFVSPASLVRCAFHFRNVPTYRTYLVGFRVVMVPKEI